MSGKTAILGFSAKNYFDVFLKQLNLTSGIIPNEAHSHQN